MLVRDSVGFPNTEKYFFPSKMKSGLMFDILCDRNRAKVGSVLSDSICNL